MVRTPKETKAEKFRTKISDILKDNPYGIGDFLNDLPPQRENTQIHKPTIPKGLDTTTESELFKREDHSPNMKHETLGRLHLQIRQDLIDKLLDTVFKRKRDSKFKGRDATQRSVIEDALEYYFENNSY